MRAVSAGCIDSRMTRTGCRSGHHRAGSRRYQGRAASTNYQYPHICPAADAFGLVAISEAIASMFAYLPNVIAAVLLLVVVGTSVRSCS
jgi:hypothetical protein